jgi:hypothetical protein
MLSLVSDDEIRRLERAHFEERTLASLVPLAGALVRAGRSKEARPHVLAFVPSELSGLRARAIAALEGVEAFELPQGVGGGVVVIYEDLLRCWTPVEPSDRLFVQTMWYPDSRVTVFTVGLTRSVQPTLRFFGKTVADWERDAFRAKVQETLAAIGKAAGCSVDERARFAAPG